ncbi:MAG: hypothetical protein LQ342_004292 [Letrouitia transgressa]|nr:MAG: hypothetical protein LQ342_004292 [Letrouitia transgressa]
MSQPEKASQDEAAKDRIIKHMNKDHQDSLVRYLEHFCHLSSFSARNAKLEAVALDSLTISCNGTERHTVPIQPPMNAWSDARSRFAALDAEAVAGLDRSDITVKKYKRPRGWMAAWLVYVTVCTCSFSTRANFLPGSMLYDFVLGHVDGFARFCYTVQPLVLSTIVICHSAEAVYMDQSRLQKHSVPRFGSLWWKWMASALTEGFPSFRRFDSVVKEEKERKANAKH